MLFPAHDRRIQVSGIRDRLLGVVGPPRIRHRDRPHEVRPAVLEPSARVHDDRLPFAHPVEIDVGSPDIILNGLREDAVDQIGPSVRTIAFAKK
jgi:hypothetical protein